MRRIHKFHIEPGQPTVAISYLRFAHAGLDPKGDGCIWLVVDDEVSMVREFRIFSTGAEVQEGWNFEASYLDGSYVWHVFSRPAEELVIAAPAVE